MDRLKEEGLRPIIPGDELERLAAVQRYDVLDTPPDGAFDRITALAARLLKVPVAIVGMQLMAFLSGATIVRHFLLTSQFEAFHCFFHDPSYSGMVTGAIWVWLYAGVNTRHRASPTVSASAPESDRTGTGVMMPSPAACSAIRASVSRFAS